MARWLKGKLLILYPNIAWLMEFFITARSWKLEDAEKMYRDVSKIVA